jgi:hypothetical protein
MVRTKRDVNRVVNRNNYDKEEQETQNQSIVLLKRSCWNRKYFSCFVNRLIILSASFEDMSIRPLFMEDRATFSKWHADRKLQGRNEQPTYAHELSLNCISVR